MVELHLQPTDKRCALDIFHISQKNSTVSQYFAGDAVRIISAIVDCGRIPTGILWSNTKYSPEETFAESQLRGTRLNGFREKYLNYIKCSCVKYV